MGRRTYTFLPSGETAQKSHPKPPPAGLGALATWQGVGKTPHPQPRSMFVSVRRQGFGFAPVLARSLPTVELRPPGWPLTPALHCQTVFGKQHTQISLPPRPERARVSAGDHGNSRCPKPRRGEGGSPRAGRRARRAGRIPPKVCESGQRP